MIPELATTWQTIIERAVLTIALTTGLGLALIIGLIAGVYWTVSRRHRDDDDEDEHATALELEEAA